MHMKMLDIIKLSEKWKENHDEIPVNTYEIDILKSLNLSSTDKDVEEQDFWEDC